MTRPTVEQLSRELDTGRTLVLRDPTEGERAELRRITGVHISGPVPLVGFVKDAQGVYHSYVKGDGSIRAAESALDDTAVADTGRDVTSSYDAVGAAETALAGIAASDGGAGLVPDFRCTWGRASLSTGMVPWKAGGDGPPIQMVAGGQLVNWVYVYYVDGVATPYFVVVVLQSGSASPGPAASDTHSDRGWFQYAIDVSVSLSTSSGPLTPLGHSPSTATGQAAVVWSEGMELKSQGVNTRFIASVQDGLQLSDWGVRDMSTPSAPWWSFHQVTRWDPEADPPGDFQKWSDKVVDGKGSVYTLPDASWGAVDIETVSAWRLDPVDGKAAVPVTFSVQFNQSVANLSWNTLNYATNSTSTGWGIPDLKSFLANQ
jgi:hypothetical protein